MEGIELAYYPKCWKYWTRGKYSYVPGQAIEVNKRSVTPLLSLIEMSPHKDANGWPCVGRYVGMVDDVANWKILAEVKRLKIGLDGIDNRVYQDEIDFLNRDDWSEKSFYEQLVEVDKIITRKIFGEK